MIDATVIIAAWRAENLLARAVDSALAQREVEIEVVVVDDASPDGTLAIAQCCAARNPRVHTLALKENGGPSAARNAGLAVAKGRWIAILDADDTMTPDRLTRMIGLAEAERADAVFDDFQPVDSTGRPGGQTHLAPLGLTAPCRWDLETFLAGCQAESGRPSLGYLKPILRRDFLIRQKLHYDESLRNGEDFHLIAALLAAGGALWVSPEAGYQYTTGSGSISARLAPDHARALGHADAVFLERYGDDLSPRAVELMRRRQRRLADWTTAETVLQALRAGRPKRATGALLRRPRAIGRLAQQSFAAARRRLN